MLLSAAAARGSQGVLPSTSSSPLDQGPAQLLFGCCACFAGAHSSPGAQRGSVPRMTLCFYLSILLHDCVEAVLGVVLALVVASDKRRAEDSEQKAQNSAEAYGLLRDIVTSIYHMTF